MIVSSGCVVVREQPARALASMQGWICHAVGVELLADAIDQQECGRSFADLALDFVGVLFLRGAAATMNLTTLPASGSAPMSCKLSIARSTFGSGRGSAAA
jgi:hypothetical protein